MTIGVQFTEESAERIASTVKAEETRSTPVIGGRNARDKKVPPIFAEITANETDGFYSAKQKAWDGNVFIDFTGARIWDNTPTELTFIFEINGGADLADGTIVIVERSGDTNQGFQWMITNSGGAGGGGVDTPFKGEIDPVSDQLVAIGVERSLGTYVFRDTITIGLDTEQKAAKETVSIAAVAADAFVYYTITKSGSSITATLTATAAYPVQVDGTLFIVLGKASWDGSKVDLYTQFWHGDIHVPSRFG